MLQDILNTSHDVIVEGKKYQFEFDHSAYAAFEQQSHKSILKFTTGFWQQITYLIWNL